jgi:uncharacterized protein (DUF1501 family)
MSSELSRRRFLRQTLSGGALVSLGLQVPTFLASSAAALGRQGRTNDRVLVVVQLTGGNDGLNTVIPYADPEYARNRIVLRIAGSQVLKLDEQLGLHPSLEPWMALWEQQRLAIVQGVGYPNPNRSHFRSLDIWCSARPEEAAPRSGWLGRALDAWHAHAALPADTAALHHGGGQLPLALVARHVAVPSVDSLEVFQLQQRGGALAAAELRLLAAQQPAGGAPGSEAAFLTQATLAALDSSARIQQALAAGRSAASYPEYPLARKLRNIAEMIDAGLGTRIYYVALDGFDTHAAQLAAHAALLRELGASLAAFVEDLAQRGHGDRVLVMSFSEFGRRVRENASAGTDHGAAAPMFVAGGAVRGGLIGPHPSLSDLEQGDLRFHTDFRQVYATVLDRWLGCSSADVLGASFPHVSLLRSA